MSSESETPKPENRPNLAAGIAARVGTIAFFVVLQAVVLFLAAGRLDWTWAWVYLGICLLSIAINGMFLLRTSPETIAERGRPQATQNWDKVIGGLWALVLYLILPLVAGLDARYGWTGELSAVWNLAGAVVLAAGLELGGWAMIANAYFSTAVRIQSDRGQTVCSSGPYRFVRHPGYVGFILQSLGTPLLLGSWWALLPGLTAVALIVIRTILEDRLLQAELAGYPEYTRQVRYRLVPGVW
jgi:protein-S-isoprenylcysteine O-methyltransferase Ste14